MITVFVRDCKISQSIYDSIVNNLQIHRLACPSCGHSACLSIHGYYTRSVKLAPDPIRLCVMRLKCSECGKTHAVLLSSMVPYSQICLSDHLLIIRTCQEASDRSRICESNHAIDENNIKSVFRSFRRCWEQKLISLCISLSPVPELIRRCFSDYSAQFMQIRNTVNALFPSPT